MIGSRLKPVMTVQLWSYSLTLIVGYFALFQLWMGAERSFVVASGVLWSVGFVLWGTLAWRRGYFADGVDLITHFVVIVDVLLEAVLLEDHSHSGFWLCGGAFATVVGGYRWFRLSARRRSAGGSGSEEDGRAVVTKKRLKSD